MLGRKGLWFKMNFFEGAARVPLMIAASGLTAGLIETPVSTIDLTPTLCDLAGISMEEVMPWTDGESLVPLAQGQPRSTPVAMEYAAEGSITPMVALRQGAWKYIYCETDPGMMFNLEDDPNELKNLCEDPAHADKAAEMVAEILRRWDPVELKEDIIKYGKEFFSREIISLHKTKGKCNFEETRQLFLNNVLTESLDSGVPAYYNSNILSRYFRKDYYDDATGTNS